MKTTKMSNSNKVDLYCYDIYGTLNYTHLEDYATQHEHIKRLEKKSFELTFKNVSATIFGFIWTKQFFASSIFCS